jgi:hypothetical protein
MDAINKPVPKHLWSQAVAFTLAALHPSMEHYSGATTSHWWLAIARQY